MTAAALDALAREATRIATGGALALETTDPATFDAVRAYVEARLHLLMRPIGAPTGATTPAPATAAQWTEVAVAIARACPVRDGDGDGIVVGRRRARALLAMVAAADAV